MPQTLLDAVRYFADPDVCVDFVAAMRWPGGVECPHCKGKKVSYLSTRRIWKCMNRECHQQFSVKTFSVFEDSPLPLDKWMLAVWLVVNCKNGVSSWEIHRDLHVTQKTAWFMLHRIRLALKRGFWGKMGGEDGGPVEVDEAFIGPKPQKMHRARRLRMKTAENGYAKTIVMGMLDRDSRQVRAMVVPDVQRGTLQAAILNNVQKKSKVYTDGATAYDDLNERSAKYVHETVNHVDEYVRGQVHTNGIENFWSLLRRSLTGTYVAVEPFHMERYLDEQVYRFNNRATRDNPLNDFDRFALALSQIAWKRLTYAELTGKVPGSKPF